MTMIGTLRQMTKNIHMRKYIQHTEKKRETSKLPHQWMLPFPHRDVHGRNAMIYCVYRSSYGCVVLSPPPTKIDDKQLPIHADCEMLTVDPLHAECQSAPPPGSIIGNHLFMWTVKC